MLVQDEILLLKYWFSINDNEQEKRFQERIDNEERRWKLSPMDIESRNRWVEYSKAKDTVSRLIDPPLPAASRPLNRMIMRKPVAFTQYCIFASASGV